MTVRCHESRHEVLTYIRKKSVNDGFWQIREITVKKASMTGSGKSER